MADDSDDVLRASDAGALAAQIALGTGAQESAEAREYLKKQSLIADLTIDTLRKKDEFELSHLRFRRYSDWTKFALEIAGFLVVLLIVGGLGTMVWNASRDGDLVVDAFSVPQDVAQTGLTGSVLAGRVLDRFGRMQTAVWAFTQGAGTYRADAADSVRVEIPQTGISIAELNRYLRAWLGHEVHVTGDLVRTADGGFALTTRYGTKPGNTVTAKASGLDGLTEKSAEQIFAAALPYRYVEYLVHQRRFAEASALLPGLAMHGSAIERATANTAWAKVYFYQGDIAHALAKGQEAARLDPQNGVAWAWLGATEGDLGHEERGYTNLNAALRLIARNTGADQTAWLQTAMTSYRDEFDGDYTEALRTWDRLSDIRPLMDSDAESASSDAAADHDLSAARRFASTIPARDAIGRPDPQGPLAQLEIRMEEDDWVAAARYGVAARDILNSQPDRKWNALGVTPDIAWAMARAGDLAGAKALVAKLPTDCDACLRVRGRIAAFEGRVREAAQAFSTVAARSPHEPFAETFWGGMLLHKGNYDGAITKFATAHAKGPHFADPLEMWGEALIAKNRSDLALVKFEEANKYAPDWGRLHLKWGEALMYAGRRDEAQKQFELASHLELTDVDRTALAQLRLVHD